MIHNPELLERLAEFEIKPFSSEVYRACRKGLDPTTSSTRGGRWAKRNGCSVLYTSLTSDGALAELSFHWGQLNPVPTKQAFLYRLRVTTKQSLRLIMADLATLGVNEGQYSEIPYPLCQEIGEAVGFLGCDGLIVPSARWNCENLVLFTDSHSLDEQLEIVGLSEVDWLGWARKNGVQL